MDFWRAYFGLFRTLIERVPWERVLKDKGVHAGWTFFKEEILKAQEPLERLLKGKGVHAGWTFFKKEVLKAQEQAVPMCRKMNQEER